MSGEENKLKIPALIGIAIAVVGAVLSAILLGKHLFPDLFTASMGCTLESGVDGCKELGESKYSKLFGIPIALLGLFYYNIICSLFLKIFIGATRDTINGLINLLISLVVFGFILDLSLAYINFFKLIYPCVLCAYTYIVTLGLFVILIWMFIMNDRKICGLSEIWMSIRPTIFYIATALFVTGIVFGVMKGVNPSSKGGGGSASSNLLPEKEVKSFLEDFRSLKPANLNAEGLTDIEGLNTGYIIIHDFFDFRCPHCAHTAKLIDRVRLRWPGRIRVFYRHFPLDGTCNKNVERKQQGGWSCNGAQAAICAGEQGITVALTHSIFDLQESRLPISPAILKTLTEKLGGNWDKMFKCMGSARTAVSLERDIKDAVTIKLEATPTLVVQDRLLPAGTPDKKYFFNLMDALVYEKEGVSAYKKFGKKQ